jgi:patatin-related protein
MREKELRLALVCFGGVSLAIYIHGVSKEILKLARASKAIHADADIHGASRQSYIYPNENVTDIPDTELVYFDILKSFSPELDLRIIVDTIAGASAGGMNSVFLARAIAHDLNFDHLRHHWLIEADVSRLTGNKKTSRSWKKIFIKPIINMISKKMIKNSLLGPSAIEKLNALLNIWDMKPPFDGKHLVGLVFGGLRRMGQINKHSLLPLGHKLELFVTLTDFYGYKRGMPLNDPAYISELEHRHNLQFSYIKKSTVNRQIVVESDFNDDDLPALSFAARATSCFPGAFPPAQLREIDHFLKEHNLSWLKKAEFIRKNFKNYSKEGINPELTSFLDGSILNNKPFDQAIKAIQNRPAFREVDRRVIYIDPNPERIKSKPTGAPPTLLNTMRGAMSDIPMNEPMHDDLKDINAYNLKVRTIKAVVDSVKPSVQRLVYDVAPKKFKKTTSVKDLAKWRKMANARAISEAGFSYEAYARLKIRNSVANLTTIIADICDLSTTSKERRQLSSIILCWVLRNTSGSSLMFGQQGNSGKIIGLFDWARAKIKKPNHSIKLPYWVEFLRAFDVGYQKRRIQFLLQDLNKQYAHHPQYVRELDGCKMSLYHILENLKDFSPEETLSNEEILLIKDTFIGITRTPFNEDIYCTENITKLDKKADQIEKALTLLSSKINMQNIRNETDQLIATHLNIVWNETIKQDLVISYLGFAFWDVITFSIMGAETIAEFNEILVNRISPNDNLSLKKDPLEMTLKGTALKSFGAFFSRSDRENDYLWGRLNGAERLIDFLYNQAVLEGVDHKINVKEIKKSAFQSILNTEKEHLVAIPELLEEISQRIENL